MMNTLGVLLLIIAGFIAGFTASQNSPEKPINFAYHDCIIDGGNSNLTGYQSMNKFFQCKEGRIAIGGKWGEEIQNGYRYPTEFGDPTGHYWIGDLSPEQQMPKFQKWCPTKYGWSLCGWNDEEVKREQKREEQMEKLAPPFKRPE